MSTPIADEEDSGAPNRIREQALIRHLMTRGLTASEARIALLVSAGLTNRQIGSRCGYRENTVKVYLHRVYAKLNLGSRVELAVFVAGLLVGTGS